jgi:uncharacterized protein YbjT (DUF2867 family)
MKNTQWNVVTGATGYTGKYITRRLLNMGERVKTLTGHPNRHNPFGSEVPVLPFNFDNPDALTESLRDVHTIYNTYWVRFTHGHASYGQAVKNTKTLIQAAKAAGVQRFVHVSIANPDKESTLSYYKGKALLEEALVESGLSYAILRPTVIFGPEDILINNIAWLLRKFPLFAIPGSGQYGIQPIFVEDMAELAIRVARDTKNVVKDAVGPETFTFKELVHLLARKIRSKSLIFHLNPRIALALTIMVGKNWTKKTVC